MTFSKAKAAFGIMLAGVLASALLMVGCSGGSDDSSSKKSSSESTSQQSPSSEKSNSSIQQSQSANYTTQVPADDPYGKGIHHAVMTVEGYAPVTIELNADAAPVTVANFAKLVNDGFYDGLTFNRFQEGFCMQGGAPTSASPNVTPIVGEFTGNGRDNPLAEDFKKGIVAMARTSDPNSATSQFFITLGSDPTVSMSLNEQYAAFGTISDADLATIDQIVADYLAAGEGQQMGFIQDPAKQAKIASIKMVD